MRSIERIIAEGSGKGHFIANGCYGKVFHHGSKRVYKLARLDGTAVWLERCFAIQKRLGITHPLCKMMPEIFSFRIITGGMYEVVMAKYKRVYDGHPAYDSCPAECDDAIALVGAVLGKDEYGYSHANDMHRGNILFCSKRGWIVTDPSYSPYSIVRTGVQDPKFARAKRVATLYGPGRQH